MQPSMPTPEPPKSVRTRLRNLAAAPRKRAAIARNYKTIPKTSGGLPVLGHTVDFVRDTIGLLERAHRDCGEVAELQVAHLKMYLLTGAEAAEAFYRAPDKQLSPSVAYKMMVPVFGKDIVYDAPPAKMTEQLRMLLPALRDRRMRTYGEIIAREVRDSIASWGDEGVIDIAEYTRVLTNFTSSHCLLGHEFRNEMTEEFAQVYHDLERGITPAAYIHPHLPLPAFRKRDKARARLGEMIGDIVKARRGSGREGEDFLQTLMDANYKSGEPLSEHEITGMLLAAMFAGHHTSSVTTAWAMLELLEHPEYLQRMTAQIDEVYAGGDEVSFESVRALTLTENLIKETLRVHPPLFMLLRGVVEDFEYKDYLIPKGSFVINSPLVSHQMPEVFKDPHRFDPDRFGPDRAEDKAAFTFLSFGAGRHKCMGNAFAQLQVKTIFAILLQEFEFESVGDPLVPEFGGVVLGPKQPCRIRYRRRQHADVAPRMSGIELKSPKAPKETPAAERPFYLEVDEDLCQGHGVCEGEAPEIFDVGSKYKVRLRIAKPEVSLRAKAELAIANCPTGALSLVEVEGASDS